MRKILLSLLAGASLSLAGAAAVAQPQGQFEPAGPPSNLGPSPGEQHDMHTGAPNTNGSSSVAYDRDGAHADGFPKIRVADYAGFESRAWRRHHHHHHAPPYGG